MTKQSHKNKKLNPADIAYEVNELIRKNNLDINHGIFRQVYTTHKMGAGCPKCAGIESKTGEEIAKLVSEFSSKFMIS